MADKIIIMYPEFASLKEAVEKLRAELSALLSERDELRFVICKNIEMKYMLSLGALECKAYELNCTRLRLKRKAELIQARKNRQERVSVADIERVLDDEFAEYRRALDEHLEKMNEAINWRKCEFLSVEEAHELKSLYRAIVKALHPDMHPDITEAELRLFQNAVAAYKVGDLTTLRIINETITEPMTPEPSENAIAALIKEEERLSKMLDGIKAEIDKIKSSYPYTLREIVESEELSAAKKAELEGAIAQLQNMIEIYNKRINDMLR